MTTAPEHSTRTVAHRLARLTALLDDRRELAAELGTLVERLQAKNLFAVTGESQVLDEVKVKLAAARDRIRMAATGAVGAQLDNLAAQLDGPLWRCADAIVAELTARLAEQDELVTQIKSETLSWTKRVADLGAALSTANTEGASVLDDRAHVIALESLLMQVNRARKQEQFDQAFTKVRQLQALYDDIERKYQDKHQAPLLTVLQTKKDRARVLKRRAELVLLKVPKSGDFIEYTALLRTQNGADPTAINLPGTSEVIRQDRETVRTLVDQATEAVNQGIRKLSATNEEQATQPTESGGMADQLRGVGDLMYSLLVPDSIQRLLAESSSSLTITTNDMEIPWELMHDGEDFLCQRRPFSRMPVSKAFPRRMKPRTATPDQQLKFLLVYADPTDNLGNAEKEVLTIKDQLEKLWNSGANQLIQITTLMGDEATGRALNEALLSGDHHVIHYAGHADFDPENPERSHLVLADGERFMAQKIQRITRGNPFVFLNACESSRAANGEDDQSTSYRGNEHMGLATAFVYGGASACVGALWPVYDDLAAKFAVDFYQELLNGTMVGEAMRCARQGIHATNPDHIAWAAYALYGDPTMRLPVVPATARPEQ